MHKILCVSELLHNSVLIFMLPELFQVSVMQMKQDYGLTWMWNLLLQFAAWCNSDVQQAVG